MTHETVVMLTVIDACVFGVLTLLMYILLRREFRKIQDSPHAIMKSIENDSTDLDTSMGDLSRAITSLIGRSVMISDERTNRRLCELEKEVAKLKEIVEGQK